MKIHRNYATAPALCFIFSVLAIHASAQGLKTATAVMDFSTTKTAGYKSWSADYAQTVGVGGNQVTVNGQIIHKQPGKMWLAVDLPAMGQQGKMTMVMGDDGVLWQVMDLGAQHQITKIDVNRVTSNTIARTGITVDPLAKMDPSKQWETGKQMFDYVLVEPQPVGEQPMYVMEGSWKAAALTNVQLAAAVSAIGRSRVFIGQSDGFPHRFEQYDKSKTNLVTAMEFKNVKFNVDVPDSTFVYRPPPSAQVMDMTPVIEMQLGANTQAEPARPAEPRPAPSPAPGSK